MVFTCFYHQIYIYIYGFSMVFCKFSHHPILWQGDKNTKMLVGTTGLESGDPKQSMMHLVEPWKRWMSTGIPYSMETKYMKSPCASVCTLFFFRSYTPVMTRLPIWWRQQLASLSSQASKSPAGTGRGRVGQPVAEDTTPAGKFLVVSIPKTGECLKMRPTWPFWSGKPADYAGYASKTSG